MRSFLSDNWPLLVPLALGFLGIYFLLPQARRSKPVLGAVLAGLGLLAAGWFLVTIDAVLPERLLFYAFAGLALVGGVMLITQKNPVHAALSFALVVLSSCGLFLLQGAPFLMAATIIVYAGAIVVTFLFVIMLAQQAGTSEADQRSREPFLATLAGFVLVGALVCVLHRNYGELDGLLAQLQKVADATSADEAIAVLGDPGERPVEERTLPLVSRLGRYFGDTVAPNIEAEWQHIREPGRLAKLQAVCRDVIQAGRKRRVEHGRLLASSDLPLSTFSGKAANVDIPVTKDGTIPKERLLAANVAAVGKSLFTDYLVAVELAGMLLLVATIGAIAIAGRRADGREALR